MFGFIAFCPKSTFVEFIISLLALLIAYVSIVSIVGCYRAWIACKMGDCSAVDAGFLTFSPRKHISKSGLACVFLFRFGWGATQPHRPTDITGNVSNNGNVNNNLDAINLTALPPRRFIWARLFIAYLSSVFLHLFMAAIEMILLVGIFDQKIMNLSDTMMYHGKVSHAILAQLYPTKAWLTIFFGIVLIAAIYIHAFSIVFNSLFRGSKIFMIYLAERSPAFARYHHFTKIFLSFLVILFFLTAGIRLLVINSISFVSLFIIRTFGGI